MKTVCIIFVCLVAVAFAYYDEMQEERIVVRSTSKDLGGGYTFVTTPIGGGKYNCECFKHGKKVWPGMCGVKDKSFSYNDCA